MFTLVFVLVLIPEILDAAEHLLFLLHRNVSQLVADLFIEHFKPPLSSRHSLSQLIKATKCVCCLNYQEFRVFSQRGKNLRKFFDNLCL